MRLDELPEDLQEQVLALRHLGQTIQLDVWDALESAESIDEFRLQVDNCMDEIISEAQGVRMTLGSQRRCVVHG